MQDMKPLYWYWFTNLPYIGKKTQQKLLDYFVTPKRVYHEFDENILRNIGITSKGIESIRKRVDYKEIEEKILNISENSTNQENL